MTLLQPLTQVPLAAVLSGQMLPAEPAARLLQSKVAQPLQGMHTGCQLFNYKVKPNVSSPAATRSLALVNRTCRGGTAVWCKVCSLAWTRLHHIKQAYLLLGLFQLLL